MVKQELTKDALAKLENLRRQFADFQQNCSKLLESIQNDKFFDSKIAAGVQSSLANITTIQSQLGIIYQDLALGSLPHKLTEATENISNLQHELSLKADLIDAVDFFKALHCNVAEIEAILAAQKEALKDICIESLPVAQAKEQLQKFVEFKQFYDGKKCLLTNVSIQFGYELIYNLIENKAGYYTETIVAAAEDKPEPSTNIVLADEVKTATSEVIVAAKVENKADAVAEAEAKIEPVVDEVAEDKPEPSANEVVAHDVNHATNEAIVAATVEDKADTVTEAKVEPVADEVAENKTEPFANEAKGDDKDGNIDDASEDEPAFIMPTAPIPKEIFSSVTIEPEISRAADKENKTMTASIAARERKKLLQIGCLLEGLVEFNANALVNAKWLFASSGRISKKIAADSLGAYAFALDNCKKYGYAVKYDCGNGRCFYTITPRGSKAFSYIAKRDPRAVAIQQHFIDRMNQVNHLVDLKAFDLMLLYMSFADIIRCLSVESGVQVLGDSFDHDGKFWLGACTIKKAKSKVSALVIAFNLANEVDVVRFYKGLMELKATWQNAASVIFIAFGEACVKGLGSWLAEAMGDDFTAKAKYYYTLDKEQLCSYDDDHVITEFDELAEAAANVIASDEQSAESKSEKTVAGDDAAKAQTEETVTGSDAAEAQAGETVASSDAAEAQTGETVTGSDVAEAQAGETVTGSDAAEAQADETIACSDEIQKLETEDKSALSVEAEAALEPAIAPAIAEKEKDSVIDKTAADATETVASDTNKKQTGSAADDFVLHPLTQQEKEEYYETYKKILMTGKTYCACAYLKRLAELDASFKDEYLQLAYAVNDPLAACTYNSDQIANTYLADGYEHNSYYLAAAILRNFYSNQCLYDYAIDSMMDSFAEDKLLVSNDKLKHLIDILRMFKKEHHCGMGKFADYKKSDIAALKAKLDIFAKRAMEQSKLASEQSYNVAITNARFGKTLEYLFRGNSDLASFLDMIAEKEKDEAAIELMKQYLQEHFIKENALVAVENINSNKIDELIDIAWDVAGNLIRNKKKTSKLVSGPRVNLRHRLEEIGKLISEYLVTVEQINNADEDDKAYPAYQKAYKTTSRLFQEIIAEYEAEAKQADKDYGYKLVLIQTLKEIYAKMKGDNPEFTGKYFYLPFLGDSHVLLNANYQPEYRDIKELPAMGTLARIEKHAFEGGDMSVDLQVRLKGIMEKDTDIVQSIISDDNYGSLRLLTGYINDQQPGFEAEFMKNFRVAMALDFAKKQAKKEFEDFSDELALFQSYGQIDNTEENKKEIILQTAGLLYEASQEDDNYGFFEKVLVEFKNKIQRDAVVQGDALKQNLENFLLAHQELKENEAANKLIERIRQCIDSQKYSSAEELLNRLENDDYESLQELEMKDYLQDFLNHYNNYIKSVANNDKTLRAQVKPYRNANKDTRAAERLLNAWPKGNNDIRPDELLSSLGFKLASVDKMDKVDGKFPSFFVKLQKALGGRVNNYNYPVPAFGSLGETDGFRIVYIFGAYDAERLVEIFNNIGDEKHTLIILDYALKESARRRLALLVKGKANCKIFAVLDRVVLKYLYDNYSEQTITKQLLHIIMPFAYYQPYVADSSKPMPSELFIGRKEELKKIKDVNGVNIVYGGRQLGKSALLMKAKKDIDKNESGDRAVYIDIKGRNYSETALKISEELVIADILEKKEITSDWRELAMSIRMRLKDEDKPIHYFLLLLDEADAFLDSCKDVQYKPFDALKDIQAVGEGRFKFVVAGLRDVLRFEHEAALNDNSVLPQLSSMIVKPFKYAEAKELLEYPLSYLGFRFRDDVETDTLVSAILSHTNSFPGMLQLYCTKLIEAMKNGYAGYKEAGTPPYYVSEDHIKKVLGEDNLQEEIRQKFFITLTVGSDNYYLLIAMITAYLYKNDEGICVTPNDVLTFAKDFEIKDIAALSPEKVAALMEEMRELNVLQHNGEHGYRFTHFSFFQMMGTKAYLEQELEKYMGDSDE
ncbi:hypothetical protein [Phascolarctobacterium succinatutens]|uniref:hypothetical protein n=1 Tax=Phascolarctobacterium succinatutens TaxID=626940 RepID=UPI0025DA80A4|nr:hypothetical protein [Phascolarctobacterium succinatutens]